VRRGTLIALAALAAAAAAVIAVLAVTGGSDSAVVPVAGGAHPVAGTFQPDNTTLAECGEDGGCYEQAFGNLAYKSGPKLAMAQFATLMAQRKPVESNCHRIAHTIGSAALARFEGNVAKTFAEGASTCWSGYYHGVLERAFVGAGSFHELGRRARRLCDDAEIRSTNWMAYQCVHGLGHGLMIQTGYALPTSLQICDRLATDWDRTSCHGGVFMENISSSYGVRSKWLRDDDPVYPCPAVEEQYKLYCYLMVTSRILEMNGYDFPDAAARCARVERNWVSTCYQSLGRDASGHTRQDPQQILAICTGAGAGASDCIYGAARDMTANYSRGNEAAGLCRIVRVVERPRCFNGIGTIVASFGGEQATRNACATVAGAYVRNCLEGAGLSA
jgi:hypothetical protein